MALPGIKLRIFRPQAVLVVAALISLCVSGDVGPRFVPLPALSNDVAQTQSPQQGEKVLHPSHSQAGSFRVPMMGQKQNRTGREPQQPQPMTLLSKGIIVSGSAVLIAQEHDQHSSRPVSPPLSLIFGRAPPV
jgi:hypothetical protein